MLCDDLKGWDVEGGREVHEGGDVCIADSFHCIAATYTKLKLYPL